MKKTLNSFQMKCICVAMMTIGMVLQVVCRYSLLPMTDAANGTQNAVYFLGLALYLLAFPLSAYLLVEAVRHTKDKKKLLLRLLFAAVITDLAMDVATFGFSAIGNWGQSQNYFFTLVLGACVLYATEVINKRFGQGTLKTNLLQLAVYLASTMGAVLLRTEQGSVGVLTIIALSVFYGNKMFSLVTVAALYIFFVGSSGQSGMAGLEYIPALSVLLIWMHGGEQGKANRLTRVVFYAAYPVAYCLMGILIKLL